MTVRLELFKETVHDKVKLLTGQESRVAVAQGTGAEFRAKFAFDRAKTKIQSGMGIEQRCSI